MKKCIRDTKEHAKRGDQKEEKNALLPKQSQNKTKITLWRKEADPSPMLCLAPKFDLVERSYGLYKL